MEVIRQSDKEPQQIGQQYVIIQVGHATDLKPCFGGTVGRPAESPSGWNIDQETSKILLIGSVHQPCTVPRRKGESTAR